MKTVREILQDADPLRYEPPRPQERERIRQVVVTTSMSGTTPRSGRFHSPVVPLALSALIVLGIVAGSRMWSQAGATLQAAAIRFEVRLAEDHSTAGLREARIAGTDRVVYLHPEIIVTNGEIVQSSVVPGDRPSRFGVRVQFNAAGAAKMRQATANHVGRPMAILLDGQVVTAPVLRSPISTSAMIRGDYTEADGQRIVTGIGIR